MVLTLVIYIQSVTSSHYTTKYVFTCRAPKRKGSMRGHMLTPSASISTERENLNMEINIYAEMILALEPLSGSLHENCGLQRAHINL